MTLVNPGNRYAPDYAINVVPPDYSGQSNVAKSTRIQNTTGSVITQDLIDAITADEVQVIRRVEIYEKDGLTPWLGRDNDPNFSPRVISGGVAVSGSSDNRRSLDLTLSNSDGTVPHDPETGLWYDKVIKVYRGVAYNQNRRMPRVAVINQAAYDPNRIGPFLGQIGLADVSYLSSPVFSDFADFDILVAYAPTADFDSGTAALMAQAFAAGMNVLSFSAYASPSTVPMIATASTQSGTGSAWTITAPTSDRPWAGAFRSYSSGTNKTAGMKLPNTLAAGVQTGTEPSSGVYTSFYQESQNGGRWFHYQPDLYRPFYQHFAGTGFSLYNEEKKFLKQVAIWLFDYEGLVFWETQVGEFVIDRITEPRFPKQIKITGRDYSKRFDKNRFQVATTYAAGTTLGVVIQALAGANNLTKINNALADTVLTSDAPFDRTTSYLDAINSLSSTYNFEWFFDKFGVLVIRAFQDPATSPATLKLSIAGDGGSNMIEYSKQSDDSEVYNVIVVTGSNADGADTYNGLAINDNADSPTCVQRLGEIPYFYTSSFFTSDDQCQAYAESVLAVKSLEAYQLDFDALVFPWIEVNEILEFDSGDGAYPTRFLFTDGNIPLDLGTMSGSGKRVAKV